MKNIRRILFIKFVLLLYPITAFSGEWTFMDSVTASQLNDVWGSSGTDVFAVGYGYNYGERKFYGTIFHYDGSVWTPMVIDTTSTLWGVWGSSGSDIFAVGDNGTILHYNGSIWSAMSSGTSYDLSDVWGSSGADVFAVGGTILHYDGSTWSPMSSPCGARSVWGSSGRNVFAVGGGTILHYNGLKWSVMKKGGMPLYSIWGSSRRDVFAVGDDGTILHYNGIKWTTMKANSAMPLYSIWGSSGKDVFAVGNNQICTRFGDCYCYNTTLHYDGHTWSVNSSSDFPDGDAYLLHAVWGSDSNDVFEVGTGGIILHYSGPATTTTVPGGGLCPAQTVMGQNHLALNKIRTLRNEMFIKTGLGKYYTALYYKHAFELSQIFANDEELREKSYRLVQKVMPAIEELLAKREAEINEDSIREGIELIDVLITQAGAELGKDLNNLKKDIQEETILKTFKVKIRKN